MTALQLLAVRILLDHSLLVSLTQSEEASDIAWRTEGERVHFCYLFSRIISLFRRRWCGTEIVGISLRINRVHAQDDDPCSRAGTLFVGCYLQAVSLEAFLWRLAWAHFIFQDEEAEMGTSISVLWSPWVPSPCHLLIFVSTADKSKCPFQDSVMGSQEKGKLLLPEFSAPSLFKDNLWYQLWFALCPSVILVGGSDWVVGKRLRAVDGVGDWWGHRKSDFALRFKTSPSAFGKRSIHPTEEKADLVTTRDAAMGSSPLPVTIRSCSLFFCSSMGCPFSGCS